MINSSGKVSTHFFFWRAKLFKNNFIVEGNYIVSNKEEIANIMNDYKCHKNLTS